MESLTDAGGVRMFTGSVRWLLFGARLVEGVSKEGAVGLVAVASILADDAELLVL